MTEQFNVAIAGATGAVGVVLRDILARRKFPIGKISLLASERSAGKKIDFNSKCIEVEVLDDFDFSDTQIAFFSAGGSVSAKHVPRAAASGSVVIDNTSKFRYEDHIPLVVPEVNAHRIKDGISAGIIANPNCSTIQMVVALKPIYDAVGISRINVATYQAVSGAGTSAVLELEDQTRNLMASQPIVSTVHPVQIAFNAIPQINVFEANGYTTEEMKMVWETQKIFEDDSVQVNPTCVRIPVKCGHSEAVNIETREPINAEQARQLLSEAPGVVIIDEHAEGGYPTAALDANGTDPVFVGRIRKDISHSNGLNMWVVSDNLRKGAALNSVQIAEELLSLLR